MTETASRPARSEHDALRAALADVRRRIDDACRRARREAGTVELVAVSKAVPAARIHAALAAGVTVFGENRVQEADVKARALPGVRWQLVGRLQSNKAARAVEVFEAIQALDSVELGRLVARIADEAGRVPYPVYVQVNVDRDPAKAGLAPEALGPALDELAELPALELRGLMTVGRQVRRAEQARPTFAALRELSERLRARQPRLGDGLSMGMSDDFEIAIEEGATLVRIGRALFGERHPT